MASSFVLSSPREPSHTSYPPYARLLQIRQEIPIERLASQLIVYTIHREVPDYVPELPGKAAGLY